jgi:hypothetical protein
MVMTAWSNEPLLCITFVHSFDVMQASLDSSKKLGPEHHVIDVANVLKMFFRELPEPLIPHAFHEVLLR